MNTDDLSIPSFLRRPMTPAIRKHLDKISSEHRDPVLTLRNPKSKEQLQAERNAAMTDDERAERTRKLQNVRAKANRRDKLPSDFSIHTHRWDPRKGQFVRDQFAHLSVKFASGLVMNDSPVKQTKSKAPRVQDDLSAKLAAFTPAQLREFANANGVWQDKYDTLPNPGLVRMNVLNRLRARVKAGQAIKW